MSIHKEGTVVFWTTTSWQGIKTQRAGEVVAVCPSEVHPNNLGMGRVISDRMSARNEVSYLIKIPSSPVLFWVSNCSSLTPENEHILLGQRRVTVTSIDRSDRFKLKKCLRGLGTSFTESENMLNLETGKRIWLKITDGLEHIFRVEDIKLEVV